MGRYGTTRRHIAEGAVAPKKLHASLLNSAYAYEKFNLQPILTKSTGYGDPTGATGNTNVAIYRNGLRSQYHVKGAGQTILGPLITAGVDKLAVGQDQVNAEGVEHLFGDFIGIPNPFRYVVGTTKPVVARLKMVLEDVSGLAECAFGFRELEAFTANLDDYTDLACLNIQGTVVNLETILNNAATVTTNTLKTAADGATVELKMILQGRDYRAFYNGQEVIKAGTPFQFTAGLAVAPFFFYLNGADVSQVWWDEFEFAYLEDIDDTRVSN